MNKVIISGLVVGKPRLINQRDDPAHLVVLLCVRHRTAKGDTKRENYTINAWHNTAIWGVKNLKQGQYVAVAGYLTQRDCESGRQVEVTAREFMLGKEPIAVKRQKIAPIEQDGSSRSRLFFPISQGANYRRKEAGIHER